MAFLLCLIFGFLSVMDPPESAEACGRCHRAIHEAWKTSAHANSMESRIFQNALELAEGTMGAEVRRTCLGCHAPVAVRANDLALRRKVSWEGVTCDYCHSIESVSVAGPNPVARIRFSLVKNGPLKDADSNGHTTAYSEAFTSSLICAPCHEYTDSLGFPVLTTYTEWKNSSAAREGKQCQTCHMYQVAGKVVDPRIRRSEGAQINLHAMPGSHSLEQLNKTIGATLTTTREGGQLRIAVEVANKFAGHSVPTGSPLRQLVLEVTADSYNGQHYRDRRVYRRAVADERGVEIDREHLAMVKPAKLLSDTRLAAGEKRTEVFSFPVPEGVQTQVKATFWYYYSPMADASQQRITFLTLGRLVK
jgi:hypothetical protein